jgi:phosphoribosylformylglycinamidine (FGAM) synthase-like amidotransferase family enzyme
MSDGSTVKFCGGNKWRGGVICKVRVKLLILSDVARDRKSSWVIGLCRGCGIVSCRDIINYYVEIMRKRHFAALYRRVESRYTELSTRLRDSWYSSSW